MKNLYAALAAIAVLAGGVTVAAQSQDPPPAQAPKTEVAKVPASPAGKWNLNVDSPQGAMTVALDLKIDGENKITGTLSSPSGNTPIAGVVKEGTLEFSFSFDANGQAMEIWVESKVDDKGKMAGMMYIGDDMSFPFTGERAKEF